VFAANDRVWTGAVAHPTDDGFVQARDYRTGKVVFEREPDSSFAVGHHRCHRNKATERFLVTGRGNVEWIDLESGERSADIFLRGACSFGVLPANGLLYDPPDPCICGTERKLRGFCALAGRSETKDEGRGEIEESSLVLRNGPRFRLQPPASSLKPSSAWPMYRHDAERSGVTAMELSTPLKMAWERKLSEKPLTSAVAGAGKVVLASPDMHTVHCIDAESGESCWRFLAGARVDTPPALHQSRAFFGSRDGCLHAVDLESGELAWQLDLFPQAPRIHAFGQLESAQPAQGSVLIRGEFIYALSGRSSFLDGGLHLFKVRAADGKVIATRQLKGEVNGNRAVNAMLPDLITAGEKGFYIRNARFSYEDLSDLRGTGDHLWSPNGLLDDSWLHRVYWVYGTEWGRTWPLQIPQLPVPAGRLLCVDRDQEIIYGFGRNKYGWGIKPETWQAGEKYYQVHATPIKKAAETKPEGGWRRGTSLPRTPDWAVDLDVEARAMAVAGSHVLIAGPKGNTIFSENAFRGREGVVLQVLDKASGTAVQEIPLAANPTFDGLIAALGKVYVSLENGTLVCLQPQP
jgi:outer membrane protein assembly factor BamB